MGHHDQEHDFDEEDIFDEGKGAGGVGGDDYDSDDDFDTEGRAPDVNPYGDPDD